MSKNPFCVFWAIFGNVENPNNTKMWRLMLTFFCVGVILYAIWSAPKIVAMEAEQKSRVQFQRGLTKQIDEIKAELRQAQAKHEETLKYLIEKFGPTKNPGHNPGPDTEASGGP